MKLRQRFSKADLVGVHFALNVFISTTLLWIILHLYARLNPIWAISSMIAASHPDVKQAVKTFWGRITNAAVGCVVGLLFLVIGGSSDWRLPLALAVTVLLSRYVVRAQGSWWLQAPITAAIIIASDLQRDSRLTDIQLGLRRVGEVMLGCVMGLAISWLMSKLWPLHESKKEAVASSESQRVGDAADVARPP